MKIKDLRVDDKGLFYYMNQVKPLKFLELTEIDVIDNTFVAFHGERDLSVLAKNVIGDNLTVDTITNLAEIILAMNGTRWEQLFDVMIKTIPEDSYSMITTERVEDLGTSASSTELESSGSDHGKTSAYNVDVLVDDSSNELTNRDLTTNTTDDTMNRERTLEVKGSHGNIIDDRNKTISYLNNNLIYDTIFLDTRRMIGTLIY